MVATFYPISADAAAGELAEYRLQIELEEELRHQTEYYVGEGPVMVQPTMDPRWAARLGLTPGQPPTDAQVETFMGAEGPGGDALLPKNLTHAAYDITLSASREVSARWAAETDPAKRAVYERAHRESTRDAMAWLEQQLSWTRRGRGSTEQVPGQVAWMGFQHYSARPTLELGGTPDMSLQDRLKLSTKIPADPGLHTHIFLKNAVLCEDGHIGALDTMRLNGVIHELGAVYHARMSAHLSDAGIGVCHDRHGIAAAVSDTPESVVELFSKRGQELRTSAAAYAKSLGEDWDTLPASRRHALAAEAAAISRAGKSDGKLNFDHWRAELDSIGVKLGNAIGTVPPADRSEAARAARVAAAAEAAALTIGKAFETEAVLTESAARTLCARALIPLGGGDIADIDRVWSAVQEQGVTLKGERTALIVGNEDGRIKLTTQAQLDLELEAVQQLVRASADLDGSVSREEIDRAVAELHAEAQKRGGKFELTDEQTAALYHLASGGKMVFAVGVAGAGKTTLLQPLVRACEKRGMRMLGMATAWRQADALSGTGIPGEDPEPEGAAKGKKKGAGKGRDKRQREMLEAGRASVDALKEAGIDRRRIFATAALLASYEKGKLEVDDRTVILLDEVSQLGVRDAVRLARMQAATGCKIVGIGDPAQCQAVEAGAIMDLIARALPGQVPEILVSQRQWHERDRLIASLFRKNMAAEALAMKREDGTAELVEGGTEETFKRAGTLWLEMRDRCRRESAARPDAAPWTFGMSAPSNAEARMASQAIREVRRREGEISGEDRTIECVDPNGEQYDLQVAMGDKVRLFDRVYGRRVDADGRPLRGTPLHVGNNGAVVEIKSFTQTGFTVETPGGHLVEVDWGKIRDKRGGTGRIRLNAGECLTVDASQGVTEHLWGHILGFGSSAGAVNARRAYVWESRNRCQTYTVINKDAELLALSRARGIGSRAPITEDDVWEHVAKNLSKKSEKSSALAFSEAIGTTKAEAGALASQTRLDTLHAHAALDERERAMVDELRQTEAPAPSPAPSPAIPRAAPRPVREAVAPAPPARPVLPERVDEIAFARRGAGVLRGALTRLRDGAEALRRTAARLAEVTDLRSGVAAAERRINSVIEAFARRGAEAERARLDEERLPDAGPGPDISVQAQDLEHDTPEIDDDTPTP